MASKQVEERPVSTRAALGISAALAAIASKWSLPIDILGAPNATKPFPTFASFYPFYLQEHSVAGTRYLHYAGTALFIASLLQTPALLPGLVAGVAIGHSVVFPLTSSLRNGIVEMAAVMGIYGYVGKRLTGSWQKTLTPVAIAYSFAWVGHFFVEKNRPATFIYPTFSLMGDFKMLAGAVYSTVTGIFGGN